MSLETPLDVGSARLRIRQDRTPGLLLTDGIWWSARLWLGAVVLCGIAGWALSYLVVPPRTVEPGR